MFWGLPDESYNFKLYGSLHLSMIAIIPVILIALYFARNKIRSFKYESPIRHFFGVVMIMTQMAYGMNNSYNGIGSIEKDLPLSLCGAAMILVGILLISKREGLLQVIYFWGFAGVLQAVLMPDLGHYGPANFRFYQFWVGHIGVIVFISYMIFVHGMRPYHRSIFKSFKWLILLAAFVTAFNLMFDANYMFLMEFPEITSFLNFLPDFPLNIPIFMVLAVAFFYIVYTPFIIRDLVKEGRLL